jgi:hypothetical protein
VRGAVSGKELSSHHLKMLSIESSISPEVVQVRGYWTAETNEELRELGFADYQIRVPALVIPIYGVDGELLFHRIRPDDPREDRRKPGKVVKYEQPTGIGVAIDVPPSALSGLKDTSCRLWIVEGERKGDALVSRGECAIALLGVWSWKRDGLPLPDWDHVHLVGREVCICFDSDAASKVEVLRAERALAEYLEGRGARG